MDQNDNKSTTPPPVTEPTLVTPQIVSNTNKPKVSNHLAIAIISLFFFVPFGIPALIYASKVNGLLIQDNIEAAKSASKKAIMWSLISFGTWAILWFGILALIIFVGLSTKVEQKLAISFVTDVSNGRTLDAYSQFSSALKEVQDQSTFEYDLSAINLDKSCELTVSGFDSSSSAGIGSQTTVSGSVNCADKKFSTAKFVYDDNNKLVEYNIQQ